MDHCQLDGGGPSKGSTKASKDGRISILQDCKLLLVIDCIELDYFVSTIASNTLPPSLLHDWRGDCLNGIICMERNPQQNHGHGDGTEVLRRELLNSWNRVKM